MDVCLSLISSVFVSIFTHVVRGCVSVLAGPGSLQRGGRSVVSRGPVPTQARRAAACGSSAPCPSSSVTSTTSATSPPATTTRTGCPPRSPCPCPWRPSPGTTSGPSSAGESSPSQQTHHRGRRATRPQGRGYSCVFPFSPQTFSSLPFCLLIAIPELCDRNQPCRGLAVKVGYPLTNFNADPG